VVAFLVHDQLRIRGLGGHTLCLVIGDEPILAPEHHQERLPKPREHGAQVELVGQEAVEGTNTFKLKVTMKSGNVTFYYLDAEYYLPLRTETKRTIQGQEMNIVTVLGDYKPEGGLMVPHSIQVSGQGPGTQGYIIEKVEINPVINDEDFKMPPKPGGDR